MRAFALVLLASLAAAATLRTDKDPYLWLSDIHGARALSWVEQQNRTSDATLERDPLYARDDAAILEGLDRDDRIPLGRLDHGYIYNFWQDANHVRGIWRRTTIGEYGRSNPSWETLLDLDALDAREHVAWVWQGEECAPGGARCLVRLSPGGGDAATLREFDLRTKTFPSDGFRLSLSKLSADYLDADAILFGTDFGEGSLTTSGYPRVVKLWHRGTPLAAAQTVFEGATNDVAVRPAGFQGPFGTVVLIQRSIGFFENEYRLVRPDGHLVKLPVLIFIACR